MSRAKAVVALLLILPRVSNAQSASTVAARSSALAEVARLAGSARTAEARALLDSLWKTTPPDATGLDEVRFFRATLASNVLDATFDYEKIIADPSSERRKESLLRVAQRALIAGEPARALEYLRTLARDYPDDSSLAVALYWKAAALLDSHDASAACEANREARSHAQTALSVMLAMIDAQGSGSCPRAMRTVIAQTDSQQKRPIRAAGKSKQTAGATRGLYAVQVSAFALRSDAEEMAARLAERGLDAHADGTQRPFRVRIGHYASYAEAAAESRRLKAQKITGFVTELEQ